MNKDQENPDSQEDSQEPLESSLPEDGESVNEEDPQEMLENSSSSEGDSQELLENSSSEGDSQELLENSSSEGDSQELLENSVAEEKSGGKGWLFLLFLLIAGGAGGYFYAQEKGIELPVKLPWGLNKYFPVTAKTPEPHTAPPKPVPVAPAPKIADPVEEPPAVEETNSRESGIKEKPVPEVEATANQQPEESPPLESEPTQDKSTLPSPSVQGVIPHISGGTVEEETEESVEEKELEGPDPKMQTSNTPPAPVQLAPTFKQNPRQETSPQRSKEVQAYLNFIEDTGNKFVELVKEGWHRLLAMISQQ